MYMYIIYDVCYCMFFFRASLTDFSGMVYWERLGPSNLETWKCDWGRACASTYPCDASGICFAKNFERSMRTLTPREGWLTCSWGQLLINKSCKKSLVKVPLKLPDVKILTFCFFPTDPEFCNMGLTKVRRSPLWTAPCLEDEAASYVNMSGENGL